MLDETGCAGVSIGRGAFYNPWIFAHTQHFLRTGELKPEPGYPDLAKVMRRHLDLMVEVFGEDHGCRLFRKPASWYAKRFGPAREFKKGVTQFRSRAEFEALLATYEKWRAPFLDEKGELRPQCTGPVPWWRRSCRMKTNRPRCAATPSRCRRARWTRGEIDSFT